MLPRLASNDSAALPSQRLYRLPLEGGVIPHQERAVHPSQVQWEALELPDQEQRPRWRAGVLFVNSEATLPGDSQEYLGRGTC